MASAIFNWRWFRRSASKLVKSVKGDSLKMRLLATRLLQAELKLLGASKRCKAVAKKTRRAIRKLLND
mgnify:CR=1 FL=1